jgi:hypothetical protein
MLYDTRDVFVGNSYPSPASPASMSNIKIDVQKEWYSQGKTEVPGDKICQRTFYRHSFYMN